MRHFAAHALAAVTLLAAAPALGDAVDDRKAEIVNRAFEERFRNFPEGLLARSHDAVEHLVDSFRRYNPSHHAALRGEAIGLVEQKIAALWEDYMAAIRSHMIAGLTLEELSGAVGAEDQRRILTSLCGVLDREGAKLSERLVRWVVSDFRHELRARGYAVPVLSAEERERLVVAFGKGFGVPFPEGAECGEDDSDLLLRND